MKTLEEILIKRLEVIADQNLRELDPDGQLEQLKQVSEQLEQWVDANRDSLPTKLRHFLENYSLQKALDFVQNEGLGGKCGS